MPYRYRVWSGKDTNNPVLDMIIQSPNIDHARFVTRNLHMEYFCNNYTPGNGMQNSRSKLDYIEPS